MSRAASLTCQVLLVIFFTAAFWLRITSLEALPDPDGDECWYGVQAYHITQGEPAYLQTPTGNPLNPFHTGIEILLLKFFKPNFWILRAPAVICGVLAVVLTYVLGARIFDKTTALIASALLAALPMAILYSRKGYDCAPTPLMSVLLLYFSYRMNWKGMLAAFAGILLCHPTNVFTLPIVLTVYLVQSLRAASGDPRQQRRLIAGASVLLGVVLLAGLFFLQRPQARFVYTRILQVGHLRWGEALTFVERYVILLIGTGSFGLFPGVHQQWAFWTIFLSVLVAGTIQLARARRWDRLALVAGLLAGATSLFLVTGATALRPDANRYAFSLVVPSVFAFAVLVRSLLVEPSSRWRATARTAQHAGLLALGWALLFCFKLNCIDAYRGSSREESILTLRTDAKDPKKRAWRMIQKDLDQRGPAPSGQGTVIVAQNWWVWMPLVYLTAERRDLILQRVDGYNPSFVPHLRYLLEQGGYAVCFPGDPLDKDVYKLFPADRIFRWEAVRYGNIPPTMMDAFAKSVVVLRLKRETATAAKGSAPVAEARSIVR